MDGEERSKDAATEPAKATARQTAPSNTAAIVKIGAVMLALGGVVTYLLVSNQDVFVYSHTVNEVMAAPADFANRTLRVEGDLVDGTVQFREDPCEYRFTIAREERQMRVDFPQCIVPDTFREGMGISVVVEGRLAEDGSFHASQVIPRCPSRYSEEEQRRGRPEATAPQGMPQGMPTQGMPTRGTTVPPLGPSHPPS